nr:MAG TPA: hypothetical protein [Caudoviricetes sp.]
MLTPLLKYKYVRLVMVRLHYQSSDIVKHLLFINYC